MPNKRKTTEQFIINAKQVHGERYDYSKTEYVKSTQKVIITCPIHGDFTQTPNNHLKGQQCPVCGNLQRIKSNSKNTKYFINKANQVHNDKYDYSKSDYINNKIKVKIICHSTDQYGNEHGEFWQTPHDHIDGKCGCPKCKNKGQYSLYCQLLNIFTQEIILYEVNKSTVYWLGNQRFDIYFPKYNIAIEYNGKQHYEPIDIFGGIEGYYDTIKRDELKRSKCNENNCKLFEVRYNYSQKEFNQLIDDINNVINQRKLCNQEKM